MASKYISSFNQEEAVKTFLNLMIRAKSNHLSFEGIMGEIVNYFEADRAYVFEQDESGMSYSNTHEYCQIGVESKIDILQELPIEKLYAWINRFYQSSAFFLINDEPHRLSDPSMYELLDPDTITCTMVAPFTVDGDIVGFLGVVNPKVHTEQLLLITVMADSLYKEVQGIKEKAQLQEALQKAELLNKIYEEEKVKNTIISSLTKTIYCIYHIDFAENTYLEISPELDEKKGYFIASGQAQERFHEICETFVSPEFESTMSKFTNLKSVQRKLKQKETISMFFGVRSLDYCEGSFVCSQRDEKGQCTHALWLVRSVGEQFKLEQELKHAKSEFDLAEEIFASAGYGTYTITVIFDGRSKMSCNKKMLELIGAEEGMSEEDLYDFWYGRVDSSSMDALNASVDSMLAGKASEDILLWNHPTKGKVYVRSGGTINEKSNNHFVIRGYYGEITENVLKEKKQKEELERALLQAKTANAAKSSFLARMSHDIRTPLNGIIGLIEIGELHEEDVALLKQNRAKAKIAASHLLELINDVLDMSKLEDGSVELAHEAFDIHQLSLDILMLMGLRAKEKNLTIENLTEPEAVVEPYVYGSPLHVRQIFMNIMGNSIKYNKEGGKIFVSVKSKYVDEKHVEYVVSIRDTGIGMSPEFLEHLFEPFTQERIDARSVYEGTGLGMSIVKSLVDKMGGTIEVESEPDEGSVFTVTLTYEIAPEEEAKECEVTSVPGSVEGIKILLAEDNELNTEIAVTILEDAGAEVTTVENGKLAVEEFNSKPAGTYDVILMDIMMPEMNGYEATAAIRDLPRKDASAIPIIAMTANAFADDVKKAHEAGMNDHMAKPLNINKLTVTIMKYVTLARQLDFTNQLNPFFDRYYGRYLK